MVGDVFKAQVEKHLLALRESSPLLVGARTGTLRQSQFLDYLNNLLYFFHHSVIHLEIARTRARQLGSDAIVGFLEEKIREERGHDEWARNDLRRTGGAALDFELGRVAPATHRLLAYSVDLIGRDPELFLAYMFFHEYITVVGGPALLADLETHCGIPADHVTAVAHHVELDRRHVAEDLRELEAVVARTPLKRALLHETIDETAAHAADFYAGAVSLYH